MLAGSEIDIVAEAHNGADAVSLAKKHKPDVVLLDIRMPESDGINALDEIHRDMPDMPVVMLSTYDNPTYVARSVALGATDYVLKGSSREALLEAIRGAASGKSPSEGGELSRVASTMKKKKELNDETVPLTNREMQVLRHVALGLSNKEIAQSLTISIETVKEDVQNILRKIDVSDRTQAAVWAVRRGLV
jgi:DNA-binding NarL/FixJ family response regulator